MEINESYKNRTRLGFSTNSKGKAQLDITIEVYDESDTEVAKNMLNEAIKSVKEVLKANDLTLAE